MDTAAIHLGPRMVLSTDGSANDHCLIVGARVTYKEYNGAFSPWTDLAFAATGSRGSGTAEHLAMNRALSVVVEKTRGRRGAIGRLPSVFIYTDSRHVIRLMFDFLQGRSKVCDRCADPEYKALARHLAILVSRRVSVKVIWVKGHKEVIGNNRADRLAALAVRWALTQPGLEQGYKVTLSPETLPETWSLPPVQESSKATKRKREGGGDESEENEKPSSKRVRIK